MPSDLPENWYREQWLKIYHPRLHQFENDVGMFLLRLDILKSKLNTLSRDFYAHKKEMLGNGYPGYVEKKVQEVVLKLKDDIADEVKAELREELLSNVQTAVQKVFDANEEKRAQENKDRRLKWDGRAWQVTVMVFQSVLTLASAAITLYITWKFSNPSAP